MKQRSPQRAADWRKVRSRGIVLLTTLLAVVGVTVAVSGGAVALQPDGESLDSGSVYYAGQDVAVDGLDASGEYRVRELDDDEPGALLRTLENDDGTIEFTLDGALRGGAFVIVNESGFVVPVTEGTAQTPLSPDASNTRSADFEVITQDLSAEFDDPSTGNGGSAATVEYEIESDVRNQYAVNVSADGLDVADLTDIFGDANIVQEYDDEDTVTLGNTAEGTYDLDFTGIDADTYTFEANVTDADASDADTIEVTDTGDSSVSFAENVYTADRGDIANISIVMPDTDEATIQVGQKSNNGYAITADVVDDDDDGVAYVEFNSFTAGNSDMVSATLVGGDDDTTVENVRADGFSGNDPAGSEILDAADYRMYVGSGTTTGTIAGTDAVDARGTLVLDDREASLDYEGDTLNVEPAAGQTISGTTDLDPGTELEITIDSDTSGDPFVKRADATVQDDGSFSATADFSDNEVGSEFTVEVIDDGTTLTTAPGQIGPAETALRYDGDAVSVRNAPGQTIAGTTDLDAGTELTVRIDSTDYSDPFLFRPEATVQDDGSFAVTEDFSFADPGTEFDVTVLNGDSELTTATGQVVGNETDDSTLVEQYDTDNSGTIELGELSDAAIDYANDELTLGELSDLAIVYSN